MSLVLLYLAGLGAVSGRWLARQHLAAKPWLSAGPSCTLPADGGGGSAAKLALGIFLAVIGLLFALLVAAYGMRVPPGSDMTLEALAQPVSFVPETLSALDLLAQFRRPATRHSATGRLVLVVDTSTWSF